MSSPRALSRIVQAVRSGMLLGLRTKYNPVLIGTAAVVTYGFYRSLRNYGTLSQLAPTTVFAATVNEEEDEAMERATSRQQRFVLFASIEFDGHIYMTPRDFLESVIQERPTAPRKRRVLSRNDIRGILGRTPTRKYGSRELFRLIGDDGAISDEYSRGYGEPNSGFRIAFNMFDMDGNQQVDKQEFLVIQALSLLRDAQKRADKTADDQDLERLFGQRQLAKPEGEDPDTNIPVEIQDTTILIHLFGPKGKGTLTYDDFFTFHNNLQTEVLELEFDELSHGQPLITEVDFAKMLLRYTIVHRDDYLAYLRRVRERITEPVGISSEQFRSFCQFLNNLDDFSIAMKLYTMADRPVTQAEFARAVKLSTGFSLDPHVVNTVFQIFDADGDGRLSYSEFIAVMKDRLHRGLKGSLQSKHGWQAFKACVRDEIRAY